MLRAAPVAEMAAGIEDGACKIAADLAVADMAQVEFNDFVAGEAKRLGEILGAPKCYVQPPSQRWLQE